MSDDNKIIDFQSRKAVQPETPKVLPGNFEFHILSPDVGQPEEIVQVEGYLKFGPQFIAVVDGPEDVSNVTYAVATHLVKYVKRLGEDGETQATLDL